MSTDQSPASPQSTKLPLQISVAFSNVYKGQEKPFGRISSLDISYQGLTSEMLREALVVTVESAFDLCEYIYFGRTTRNKISEEIRQQADAGLPMPEIKLVTTQQKLAAANSLLAAMTKERDELKAQLSSLRASLKSPTEGPR